MASSSSAWARGQGKLCKRLRKSRDICVAVVGAQFVGKTAFTFHSLAKRVNPDTSSQAYLADLRYRIEISIDGHSYYFTLFDTFYQELYPVPSAERIATSDGMVIVYSVTDPDSFLHVRVIKASLPREMPVVLVATKCDLVKERKVCTADGKGLALELNCPYFEVSAFKEDNNIRESFEALCRRVIEYRNQPIPPTTLWGRLRQRGKTFKARVIKRFQSSTTAAVEEVKEAEAPKSVKLQDKKKEEIKEGTSSEINKNADEKKVKTPKASSSKSDKNEYKKEDESTDESSSQSYSSEYKEYDSSNRSSSEAVTCEVVNKVETKDKMSFKRGKKEEIEYEETMI